jgi:hypothetical protein
MTVRYTPLLPWLACACDPPPPWVRVAWKPLEHRGPPGPGADRKEYAMPGISSLVSVAIGFQKDHLRDGIVG